MKTQQTVLLVEDDADDRQLFTEALAEADSAITCLTVSDGLQALELLHKTEGPLPSLIFLDLRMPRLSGKRCLIALQEEERFRNIPVVIYTTSRSVEESRELKALGAFHFVSKPSNPEEIYYLVSMILEEHARSAQ